MKLIGQSRSTALIRATSIFPFQEQWGIHTHSAFPQVRKRATGHAIPPFTPSNVPIVYITPHPSTLHHHPLQ